MTQPPTPPATPVWLPSPTPQPPYPHQPYPQVAPMHQTLLPQGWQLPPTPVKSSALPIEPKRYHQFLQTPRRRWWKLPIALVVATVAWIVGSAVAILPAIIYDIVDKGLDVTDPVALESYFGRMLVDLTPATFLANNIGIALMIPCAWLGLIIYGQRPRWLSSVTGRLRWGWLFRLLGLIAIPYLLLNVVDILFLNGVPDLTWKPYSVFMILAILITTPLQCAGEEYGTRGLLNRVFGSYGAPRVSFWIGATLSSLVFMLLHAAADPYLNGFYFVFGLVACWMVWRTGGLEASIAMHVVNNLLAMAPLPFSDLVGVMDRSVGTADGTDVIPLAVIMAACVGIVEWQVRRVKPVAIAAPAASVAPSAVMPV